jgi:hypothetical protein
MNITTEHANGIAVVRVGESRLMYPLLSEFSAAVQKLIARASAASSSTCHRSATSTARRSAA